MKKIFLLLSALLTVILLCIPVQPAQAAAEPEADILRVSTIDSLIAAIAPNVAIQLEPGVYELAKASTYGQDSGNPYVRWVDTRRGSYLLQLCDLEGLTICGSGKDNTLFLAESRWVDVLNFVDCSGLTLEGFTGGHADEPVDCQGGVISLNYVNGALLRDLGLYGCGAWGVYATSCEDVVVQDCEIYECSLSGIFLNGGSGIRIQGCSFHDIGYFQRRYGEGYCLLSANGVTGAEIADCQIDHCCLSLLLVCSDSSDMVLKGNRFTGNAITSAAWDLRRSSVTIDSSNVLENNTITRWYEEPRDGSPIQYAQDETGADAFVSLPAEPQEE